MLRIVGSGLWHEVKREQVSGERLPVHGAVSERSAVGEACGVRREDEEVEEERHPQGQA